MFSTNNEVYMTLNHCEWRNGHYIAFFAEYGSFSGQLYKRTEARSMKLSMTKIQFKELAFALYIFMVIIAENADNNCITERHRGLQKR